MSVVISPKTIRLLRNGSALTIIIFVSICHAHDYGMLYQYGFLFEELIFVPVVALVAADCERQFGFLLVTVCTWLNAFEVYNMWQQSIIYYGSSKWQLLGDTLFLWCLGLIFSLVGTVPIFLWRRHHKNKSRQ